MGNEKLGFLVVGIFAIGLLFANTITSQDWVNITGAPPEVSEPSCGSPIDLVANSSMVVYCTAVINDTNGFNDILAANLTFWDSGSSEGAADSYLNHYQNSTCVLEGGSGTTVTANCSLTLWFNSNAGAWTAKIWAIDNTSLAASNESSVTINNLQAIAFVDAINFSSLAPGVISSAIAGAVTNLGNVVIDINVSGTNLTSVDLGPDYQIDVSKVKWAATSVAYDSMSALLTTDSWMDLSAAKSTDASGIPVAVSTDSYFMIQIPVGTEQYLPAGAYNGTINVTATENV